MKWTSAVSLASMGTGFVEALIGDFHDAYIK